MTKFIYGVFFVFSITAQAMDLCTKDIARRFADAVIEADIEINNYRPGYLYFVRSESPEYTFDHLADLIKKSDGQNAAHYRALRQELAADLTLHIYRLKYTWLTQDNQRLSFHYMVRTQNYGRGCVLKSLIAD